MFRNPVLQRPADEDDRLSRDRDRMPGEQPAYNAAHSPTQTPFSYSPTNRAHTSNPPTPAPLPLHHTNFNHTRPQPTSPSTSGLPPIASALYSRETVGSKYYDPTSDHGDRTVGRSTPRYDGHYPSQVRHPTFFFPHDLVCFRGRDNALTFCIYRLETPTTFPNEQRKALTTSLTTRL